MLFDDSEPARVSWVGGVFRITAVLDRFRELIESNSMNALAARLRPAAGALLEAYRTAGPRLANAHKSARREAAGR